MTAPTIDDVEAAWLEALLAPTTEPMRALLHPQFVAIHSATGSIQDKERFLTDTAARPTPQDVQIRRHGDGELPAGGQMPFVPDAPPFVSSRRHPAPGSAPTTAGNSRTWSCTGGCRRNEPDR